MPRKRPTEVSWDSDEDLLQESSAVSAFTTKKEEEEVIDEDALLGLNSSAEQHNASLVNMSAEIEIGLDSSDIISFDTADTQELDYEDTVQDEVEEVYPGIDEDQTGFEDVHTGFDEVQQGFQEVKTEFTGEDEAPMGVESMEGGTLVVGGEPNFSSTSYTTPPKKEFKPVEITAPVNDSDSDNEEKDNRSRRFTTERQNTPVKTSYSKSSNIPDSLEVTKEMQEEIDTFESKGKKFQNKKNRKQMKKFQHAGPQLNRNAALPGNMPQQGGRFQRPPGQQNIRAQGGGGVRNRLGMRMGGPGPQQGFWPRPGNQEFGAPRGPPGQHERMNFNMGQRAPGPNGHGPIPRGQQPFQGHRPGGPPRFPHEMEMGGPHMSGPHDMGPMSGPTHGAPGEPLPHINQPQPGLSSPPVQPVHHQVQQHHPPQHHPGQAPYPPDPAHGHQQSPHGPLPHASPAGPHHPPGPGMHQSPTRPPHPAPAIHVNPNFHGPLPPNIQPHPAGHQQNHIGELQPQPQPAPPMYPDQHQQHQGPSASWSPVQTPNSPIVSSYAPPMSVHQGQPPRPHMAGHPVGPGFPEQHHRAPQPGAPNIRPGMPPFNPADPRQQQRFPPQRFPNNPTRQNSPHPQQHNNPQMRPQFQRPQRPVANQRPPMVRNAGPRGPQQSQFQPRGQQQNPRFQTPKQQQQQPQQGNKGWNPNPNNPPNQQQHVPVLDPDTIRKKQEMEERKKKRLQRFGSNIPVEVTPEAVKVVSLKASKRPSSDDGSNNISPPKMMKTSLTSIRMEPQDSNAPPLSSYEKAMEEQKRRRQSILEKKEEHRQKMAATRRIVLEAKLAKEGKTLADINATTEPMEQQNVSQQGQGHPAQFQGQFQGQEQFNQQQHQQPHQYQNNPARGRGKPRGQISNRGQVSNRGQLSNIGQMSNRGQISNRGQGRGQMSNRGQHHVNMVQGQGEWSQGQGEWSQGQGEWSQGQWNQGQNQSQGQPISVLGQQKISTIGGGTPNRGDPNRGRGGKTSNVVQLQQVRIEENIDYESYDSMENVQNQSNRTVQNQNRVVPGYASNRTVLSTGKGSQQVAMSINHMGAASQSQSEKGRNVVTNRPGPKMPIQRITMGKMTSPNSPRRIVVNSKADVTTNSSTISIEGLSNSADIGKLNKLCSSFGQVKIFNYLAQEHKVVVQFSSPLEASQFLKKQTRFMFDLTWLNSRSIPDI